MFQQRLRYGIFRLIRASAGIANLGELRKPAHLNYRLKRQEPLQVREAAYHFTQGLYHS